MTSKNYKEWKSAHDDRRCDDCAGMSGKIYEMYECVQNPRPPIHLFCRCKIKPMNAVYAINASADGIHGAPWWLKQFGHLPEKYITTYYAKQHGWEKQYGNLNVVFPGKMIGGDVYRNWNGHLPSASGRIWHEADLSYCGGFRSTERVVYSNDGLVFITYDHYESFIEVI